MQSARGIDTPGQSANAHFLFKPEPDNHQIHENRAVICVWYAVMCVLYLNRILEY